MDGTGHTLAYQQSERPPPPTGPAPMYVRTISRLFPYSLRPVLLVSCIISLVYLVLLGGNDFRSAGTDGTTGKLKILDIVQGILFIVAGLVEVFGFYAVYSQRLPLAKSYSYLSLFAFAAVIASEILGIIVTFALKTDVINACTVRYTGSVDDDGSIFGNSSSDDAPLSSADAASYCQSLWNSDRTWDIVWLIVSLCLGALFVMFSFAYVRQILDPSSVRVRINRFQQSNRPQAQGMSGPYDPEAAFTYPPQSGGGNPAYAPPNGPPPSGPGAPPMYSGRPSMDDWDDDTKSPNAYGYGYNYGPGEREAQTANRAGSSRNVAMNYGDEDEQERINDKRDSGETLRGEDTIKKIPSTNAHGNHYEDGDDTPRI
ncbi:hypothetical protein CBS101457_005659 [Exobasidium rhododendri]|nr:hypothetical protein CBS101457_005659 [Exobasidium rhododendri]